MIIVEFIGISGCGKSTLSKRIQTELRKKGISSVNLQKTPEKGFSFQAKVTHYIHSKLAIFSKKNRHFMNTIANELTNVGLVSGDIHHYWTEKMLMLNYDILKAERRKVDIGLIDEGCIQFLTSMLFKAKADERFLPVVEVLKEEIYKDRTIIINCELEPEICNERMVARGRGSGDYNGDSVEKTIKNLQRRRFNLDFLMEPLDKEKIITVKMEGDDSIDAIMNFILQEMEKQKK